MFEEITRSERYVMKAIWEMQGEISLSRVVEEVNRKFGKEWKPQTVSTFLSKLVKKNYLLLRREGRSWVYDVLVSEEDYHLQETREYLRFWGSEKVGGTFAALCQEKSMDQEEIDYLKELIDGLEE